MIGNLTNYLGSQDRDVVLVRRVASWGKPKGGSGIWNGEGLGRVRKGKSVHEQPGAKVDGIAPHKERDSR
jgi:hypothetical protein